MHIFSSNVHIVEQIVKFIAVKCCDARRVLFTGFWNQSA